MLVDDSPVMRAGLKAMLHEIDDVDDVVMASGGREALAIVRESQTPIDLIFLDVRMPDMDGLSVLERISDIPVVMLTNADDTETVQAAMTRGARGYLVNGEFTETELAAVLRVCGNGGIILGRTAASRMSRPSPAARHDTFGLTDRERSMVDALCQGLSNQQIARLLSLSEKTVRNVLHATYAKMGVGSRTEAAAAWLKLGSPDQ